MTFESKLKTATDTWCATPSLGIVDFPSTAYDTDNGLSVTTVAGSENGPGPVISSNADKTSSSGGGAVAACETSADGADVPKVLAAPPKALLAYVAAVPKEDPPNKPLGDGPLPNEEEAPKPIGARNRSLPTWGGGAPKAPKPGAGAAVLAVD